MPIQADPDLKHCFLQNLKTKIMFLKFIEPFFVNVSRRKILMQSVHQMCSLFFIRCESFEIFAICVGGLTALGGSLADLPVDPQLGKERLFLSHQINFCRIWSKVRHLVLLIWLLFDCIKERAFPENRYLTARGPEAPRGGGGGRGGSEKGNSTVAGVLDEPYSQLILLSGEAEQARQAR